jgi:hypothetical protein
MIAPLDGVVILGEQRPHQHQAQLVEHQMMQIQVHDVGGEQPPPAAGRDRRAS